MAEKHSTKKASPVKEKKFSPDRVMLKTQRCLVRDLVQMQSLRDNLLCQCSSFASWRNHDMPGYGNSSPDMFKRLYQVSNFLKRYIAKKDAYTEKELEDRAISSFIQDQHSYGLPKDRPLYAEQLLQGARRIVAEILGDFKIEELLHECKFGKRAAAGLPAATAYLHNRVKKLSFSSAEQLDVFYFIAMDDPVLMQCLGPQKLYPAVSYAPVPKSYKAYRGVCPDTVVGSFISQGLGRLLRCKLEAKTHINLSKAQIWHQKLARKASKDLKRATIDMSKASDSFTWEHIYTLVPRTWWPVLRSVRTEKVDIGGQRIDLKSFMLMGSGHTFPLQTILFYALAASAIELLGIKDKAFVFGDDIIMPTPCAIPFAKAMGKLGFTINPDKSFWIGRFRESCGGDYYDGHDVRPAMPEGTYKPVPKYEYIAFLYKVINGLLKRWSPYEIETTLTYLLEEVEEHLGRLPCRGIPGTHAEYSAVLYDVPFFPLDDFVVISDKGKLACKQYIVKEKVSKLVIDEHRTLPYYWDKLRAMTQDENPEYEHWLAKHSAYARYCAEHAVLKRMGLRLAAPRAVGQHRDICREINNLVKVTNKRHRPRYVAGWVVTPILGTVGA